MRSLTIEPVDQNDQPKVIATLVSAFIADPVERWLYPQPSTYLTQFPAFVAAFGGEAFENQTVWRLDEFAAVAWWLPPGAGPDGNAIIAALSGSVSADNTPIRSRSSSRWTPRIPKIRTGSCPGSGSILPAKEPPWARTYSSKVWSASTPSTARLP